MINENTTSSNEGSIPFARSFDNQSLTKEYSKSTVKRTSSLGSTYSHELDGERVKGRRAQIFALMSDQKFRSLREIADTVGGSEAAASARLRDFRKAEFGSYTVISKRFGPPKSGFWKYQVLPPLSTLTEQHGATCIGLAKKNFPLSKDAESKKVDVLPNLKN